MACTLPMPIGKWTATIVFGVLVCSIAFAGSIASAQSVPSLDQSVTSYVVGPQDVLTITSYDQNDLSGKFTVESDGTFTYPLIGRVTAGGLTLRALEQEITTRLKNEGYFNNPQIAIAVETYRSQRVFIVGEVRSPGSYTLVGGMTLIEAIARAGSALPTAAGDILIVHDVSTDRAGSSAPVAIDGDNVRHVDLRDLQSGRLRQKISLRDGDTIFVPRIETVYVSGQVKTPGMYPVQQNTTTVLQALALAGGVTDRGSTARLKIIRIVNGHEKELKVQLADVVQPGDTIIVSERFF
jgi:polysaccharide biosynthesis/export protein